MSDEVVCEYCHNCYYGEKLFCISCGNKLFAFRPVCECGEPIRVWSTKHLLCNIASIYSFSSRCSKCGIEAKGILKQYTKQWTSEHPISIWRLVWKNTAGLRVAIVCFTISVFVGYGIYAALAAIK